MKKLITSIALFTSLCAIGQNNYARIFRGNDTVYVGDSTYLDIIYSYAYPSGWTAHVNIQVSQTLDMVCQFTFRHLDSVPHVTLYDRVDNMYRDCAHVGVVIPLSATLGQWVYYCNGLTYPVFVAQHLTTGIKEYVNTKQIKEVRYYNILGQETNDLKGLIIELIFYTDNTFKIIKTFRSVGQPN